jgi:putative type II/III system pilus formation protein
MMAFFIEGGGPASGRARSILAFLCTLLLAPLAAPTGAEAADIVVTLDQARLVKLPERVSTLIIGNPLIADAAVQAGGLMVITGKGYGVTNIIALDRGGAVLMENTIEVVAPRDELVVVFRGAQRESYTCSPVCEPRIMPGDGMPPRDPEKFLDTILGQTTNRSGMAQGKEPQKSENK